MNSMEAPDDLMDDLGIDWGSLASELFSDNSNDQDIDLPLDLDYLDQLNANMSNSNDGEKIDGDSNMGFTQSQYGLNHQESTPTMSNLIPNNSTPTLPRSAQILTPEPKFFSNNIAQSSQYNPLQPIQGPQNQSLRQVMTLQPQTSSLIQSNNIMFGHQNNQFQHQKPSDQPQMFPKPMVNIQNGHLHNLQGNTSHGQFQQQHQRTTVQPMQNFQQNQNQSQLSYQNLAGSSRNMISNEGGAHGFQVQQQEINYAELSAPVGFRTPNEFPNPAAWREYAFSQINIMKDRYFNDLVTMKNNARQFHTRATNREMAIKYRNVEFFLAKLITFLSTPTVDMLPKHEERVYNYMTFIVNYIVKYHNKNNRESFQDLEQLLDHPSINQPSRGPQVHPTRDIRFQQNPQSNLSQVTTNLEANMVSFNQNFPSRRPQQGNLMTNSANAASFQMGRRMEQRPPLPPRIGSFKVPSSRPLTYQSSSSNTKLNLGKPKEPMQKVGDQFNESNLSRFISQHQSPQFSKPTIHHTPTPSRISSQNSVLSRQVNVNTVLSPESIARSSFLHASLPSTPSKRPSSSSLPPLSTEESQKSETLIDPWLLVRDQKDNQVLDLDIPMTPKNSPCRDTPNTPNNLPMDPPKTPNNSPMEAELTEESNKNPNHCLLEVLKSVSPDTLKSASSLTDVCSDETVFDLMCVDREPASYLDYSYLRDKADFMLEFDEYQEGIINGATLDAAEPINNPICPNIEEEKSGFSLGEDRNDTDRNVRRKLNVTSTDSSLPHLVSDHDKVVSLEPKIDSIETSMNKGPKIEIWAIVDEIEGINKKLLETSLNVLKDPVKDSSILGDHKGIIVRCVYRNVCFPELFDAVQGGASPTTRPEFILDLLVPVDYPDSSPTIFNSNQNTFSDQEQMKVYETIASRFKHGLITLPEKASLEEMARQWDSCARSVITELAEGKGGESFSRKYGSWEDCNTTSPGSN